MAVGCEKSRNVQLESKVISAQFPSNSLPPLFPSFPSMNSIIESARQSHEEIDLYEQALAAIFLQPDENVSLLLLPFLPSILFAPLLVASD